MITILATIQHTGILFFTGTVFLLASSTTDSLAGVIILGLLLAILGNIAESYLNKNYKHNDLQD